MRTFLSEADTLVTIRQFCQKAGTIKAALALITRSGLQLIGEELTRFLSRGGELQILLGTDMATEPEAIEVLLRLQGKHLDRMVVRRFASDGSQIFHPKVWVFSFRSGGAAIIGSSNLTSGGLRRNFEANALVKGAGEIGEIEEFFDESFEGGHAKQIDSGWLNSYRDLWKQQRAARMKLESLQKKVKFIRTRRTKGKAAPTRIRGHSFAFTGTIANWPREHKLYPAIKRHGGKVVEFQNISKADCLVHADLRGGRKTTRKLRAARRVGIDVISQGDFFRIRDNELRLRKRSQRDRSTGRYALRGPHVR